MTARRHARRRRVRPLVVAGALAVVLLAAPVHQLLAESSETPAADVLADPVPPSTTTSRGDGGPVADRGRGAPGALPGGGGGLGAADGVVPDGTTVLDDHLPGLANLDPALLGALQRAQAAAPAGIELLVHSAWRSERYQQQLLDDAVARYGSLDEALRWAATPTTSAHVVGDAIDLGPDDALAWLSEHGAAHGLCQIYRNEPWHYELRPEAPERGCPAMYADATHDPRMRG